MTSGSGPSQFSADDQELINRNLDQIIRSSTYRLAHEDLELLNSSSMRGVRMLLEISKPELQLEEAGITSTIIVFGGARLKEQQFAEADLETALNDLKADPESATEDCRPMPKACGALFVLRRSTGICFFGRYGQPEDSSAPCCSSHVIVTGGGPGIMEAANRAFEAGCRSIGLNIQLPHEQYPNPYITPNLCFQFNYFALRKFHFVMRSVGAVLFPGGYGTLDELFEVLTLRQVGTKHAMPIVLFGKDYWSRLIDFEFMADSGLIDDEDLHLIQFADTPSEAWALIRDAAPLP